MLYNVISTPILGLPLFAWGGMFTGILIVIQVLIGTHILKVNFKYHRIGGFVILGLAFIHGLAGLSYILKF
jgi:hypothetical protein